MSATGQTSIVLKSRTEYDPQSGSSESVRAKFSTRAAAEAYVYSVPGFNALKWSITPMDADDWHEVLIQSSNGSYSGGGNTTVQDDPGAPLVDAWELVPTLAEKDLLESDNAMLSAVGASNMVILKNLITGSGPDVWTGDPTTTFNNNPSADYTATVKVWSLFQAGFKTVRLLAPTLRHTRMMRRDFTVQQAYDKIGRVFTTSSLKTYEQVPAQVLFDLPTTSDPTRLDGLVVHYGWLKKPASIQQVSGGQWQIQQEYDWGLWPEAIYGTTV